MASTVFPESAENEDYQEWPVMKDQPVLLDHVETLDVLEHREVLVYLALLVHQDLEDPRVSPDAQATGAPWDTPVKPVQRVNQEPKVWLVEMVQVESLVLLVPKELLVMLELLENKVLWEKLEREAWLETQVVVENAEKVVTQERLAQMER